MGFIPKICTVGRATSFPAAVEAIGGDLGLGTSSECAWHRSYPFKSSLAGYGARDLADAWEAASGKQVTMTIGPQYSGYEIVADVLKRAKTLDKETLRNAIAATDLVTLVGHVKFDDRNVAVLPSGALQWVKGTKWRFKCELVSMGNYPEIPTTAKLISIRELRGMS